MVTNNLKVELYPREDREKQIYYLGRLRFPGKIDLSHTTFLVFLSESGDEELQIAPNDKEHTTYSKYTKRTDRLKVELEVRTDQYKKIFYVAKLQMNGHVLDCSKNEAVFIVFFSKKGQEELQIVGDIRAETKQVDVYEKTPLRTVSVDNINM